MFDGTDVLSMILLIFAAMRRSDVKIAELSGSATGEQREVFERWRRMALGAYALVIRACFLKIAAHNLWFFLFWDRLSPSVVSHGGKVIALAWVGALVVGWVLAARAQRFRQRLGLT